MCTDVSYEADVYNGILSLGFISILVWLRPGDITKTCKVPNHVEHHWLTGFSLSDIATGSSRTYILYKMTPVPYHVAQSILA